jgi:hypothetical protein
LLYKTIFRIGTLSLDDIRPRYQFIALVVFAILYFALCQAIAFILGPTITSDGYRDNFFADSLIKLAFNPLDYIRTVSPEFARFNGSATGSFEMNNPVLPYILYVYLIAFAKILAGGAWLHVMVFINAMAQTVTAVICTLLVARMSRVALPIAVVMVFLVLGFDFYQWVPFSQSTPIFLMVVSTVFALAVSAWASTDIRISRRTWAGALGLSLVCMFIRPSAPPVIAMILIGWSLCELSRRGVGWHAMRLIRKGIVALLCLLLMGVLVHGYLISDPSVLPSGTLRDWLEYFRNSQALGWIMWRRPETYVNPPIDALDFAATSLLRGGYFFAIVVESFSFSHGLFNIAFFGALYGLSIIGAIAALRSSSEISRHARMAGVLAILLILLTASFVAVTYLDYDWRYRVPTLPGFLVLAAIGADRLAWWLCRLEPKT